MKKLLLCLISVLFIGNIFGQGMVNQPIIAAGNTKYATIYLEDENDVIYDTLTVLLSSDDAEEENGAIKSLFDDDLDAGWKGQEGDEDVLTVGLRFQNATIPKGATIDSAFIVVYSHEVKLSDDVANLTIYCEAADSAVTFDEQNLITSRTPTSAKINWKVEEKWEIWQPYKTPDLKSIVQEVVNRDGWKSGNAVAFVLAGENQGPSDVENAREIEAFENISDPSDSDEKGNFGDGKNHPERVPRLLVYYDGFTTATSSVQVNGSISLYPTIVNNGEIRMVFGNSMISNIKIINIAGEVVKDFGSKAFESGSNIDVSDLRSGAYFLRAESKDAAFVKQFIVQ